jgi:hypothetical protein
LAGVERAVLYQYHGAALTVEQFFRLSDDYHDRLYRMQKQHWEKLQAHFPNGPPFYLAVKDGSRLLYPVMPDGSMIVEGPSHPIQVDKAAKTVPREGRPR